MKTEAEKRFFRRGKENAPWFDLGDLYSLSLQWLELIEQQKRACVPDLDFEDSGDWIEEGVPAHIPDEVQVEKCMERILERLEIFSEGVSFSSLLQENRGKASLVVTLLALLELARRNKVSLFQEEMFGDVFIVAKEC